MLISKEWLSEFVDLQGKSDEEIAREFTLRVAEVEGIIKSGELLDRVCVGVIADLLPHPKADRLRITMVDVGEASPLTIVCGGSNLFVGQKVAVARVGSRVRWHGEGDLITLEPTEIRGVKSDGMICGADEIGLADEFPKGDEKEILDLSSLDVVAGTPLATALGKDSVLFELDNKALSNRPDLWGLRGLAREFGVVCDAAVSLKDPGALKTGKGKEIVVRVDNDDCVRYQAVAVSGLRATSSPEWMKARLAASGVRPINAIVDVTNYVMLEGGQPLHAFDFKKVSKGDRASIIVRGARDGEKIVALDGKTYELNSSMLVIADEAEPIAIAGVMGGEHHSIDDSTDTIVIESANFKAASVRRTSTALHIRTESSSRFEKSIDPHACSWGLARAVELLQQIFPEARVVSDVVDISHELPKERIITVTLRDIERVIGGGIDLDVAGEILTKLGFGVSGRGKELRITVPTFRLKDIVGVHDLVEEIVRLHGYEKIVSELPIVSMRAIESDPIVDAQYRAKQIAAFKFGFIEVSTYAYIKPQAAALFGFDEKQLLELANPLSTERPYLAPTLAMNICEVVEKNQRVRDEIRVCEVAKVFVADNFIADASGKKERAIAEQPTRMVFAYGGKSADKNYFGVVRDAAIGVVEELGRAVEVRVPSVNIGWTAEGATAEFVCEGIVVGYVGVLHPRVQKKMGIEYQTVVAEINLDEILKQTAVKKSYKTSLEFQGSERDVALVVPESVTAEQVVHAITRADVLVRRAELFDVFRGDKIGADKKAFAVHVTYRAPDRTLSGGEIDAAHAAVCAALANECGATIR